MEALEKNKAETLLVPQRRNVKETPANCRRVEIHRHSKGRGRGTRMRGEAEQQELRRESQTLENLDHMSGIKF